MVTVVIAAAGAVGALARAELWHWTTERGRRGALATAVANLVGAFALGALIGAGGLSSDTLRVAGTGFLGGFTTFSTWMVESRSLTGRALLFNTLGVTLAGVAAAVLGHRWTT